MIGLELKSNVFSLNDELHKLETLYRCTENNSAVTVLFFQNITTAF